MLSNACLAFCWCYAVRRGVYALQGCLSASETEQVVELLGLSDVQMSLAEVQDILGASGPQKQQALYDGLQLVVALFTMGNTGLLGTDCGGVSGQLGRLERLLGECAARAARVLKG